MASSIPASRKSPALHRLHPPSTLLESLRPATVAALLAVSTLSGAVATAQVQKTIPVWGQPSAPTPDERDQATQPSAEAWLRDEPWHVVDLHIFTHADGPRSDDGVGERWPDHIAKPFPQRLVALGPLSSEAKLAALSRPGLLIDNVPITALVYTTLPLYEGQYQDDFDDNPLATTYADSQVVARRIQRSSKYQLLMHRTWLQPTLEQERATPILIKAGKQYANFSELEGTIQLTRRRHVHLSVDLWLSRFVPKRDAPLRLADQAKPVEPGFWGPRFNAEATAAMDWYSRPLPSAPTPLATLVSLTPPAHLLALATSSPVAIFGMPDPVSAQPSSKVADVSSQSTDTVSAPAAVLDTTPSHVSAAERAYDPEMDALRERLAQAREIRRRTPLHGHRIDRVAPLRQNLRLHLNRRQYVDHPLFGIFVKITPYTPPGSSTPTDDIGS